MLKNFYKDFLYPLQDRVLQIVSSCKTDFYLTGGTALGRSYLNHRYSDDLDFFLNNHPDFKTQVTKIISSLKQKGFKFRIVVNDDSFVRIFISENGIELKVEFINDVGVHKGDFIIDLVLGKTDNILNILSNKICALARNEAKDIADIIYISLKYPFNWMEIIEDAKNKDMWVNEIDISMIISSFSVDRLRTIKWINDPDYSIIRNNLEVIAKEIAMGNINSLFNVV